MALTMAITVDGSEYVLRSRDISAIDAQDYRAATGCSLQGALNALILQGDADIDRVAGFVWLVRRRRERKLRFEMVAASITYDSDVAVDLNPLPAKDEEAGDPEG